MKIAANQEKKVTSLGNALDPCIAYATMTNAHDGLNCMTIDKNVTQVVGGFKDCSVRVWR